MPTDYEQLAARYDEDRAAWTYPVDDVVAELLATRGAVRVLDLGSGTGRWLQSQPDDARLTLFGADPSAAMLAVAAAKNLAPLVLAAAEAIPFRDAAFDYVVASYCFHHFTDKERALDEITRLLTSDGVFCMNNVAPEAAEGSWVYEFFPETITVDAARFWPAARIADALQSRGFRVAVEIDAGMDDVPVARVLADAERRVISQLAELDDAAYARGLARLRAHTGATVTTTRSRLCLTARRWR